MQSTDEYTVKIQNTTNKRGNTAFTGLQASLNKNIPESTRAIPKNKVNVHPTDAFAENKYIAVLIISKAPIKISANLEKCFNITFVFMISSFVKY